MTRMLRRRRPPSASDSLFEGVFRQHLVYKGRNRDTAWFSIIDSEWPALRSAYEAWLDEANFDASGAQRQGLRELIAAARRG